MITGDNPLTAVHVARDVEIVDRDALILDVPEGSSLLVWRSVDDSVNIVMDPSQPIDTSLFKAEHRSRSMRRSTCTYLDLDP